MRFVRDAVSMMLAFVVIVTSYAAVWAAESDLPEKGADSDAVVFTDLDRPYLALGADLTEEERDKVLGLMGLEADDLVNYVIDYVSNSEEHEYLDSYISSKEIGTRALSSVVIKEGTSSDGVNVSTYNINYCTAGMYKNALATAGVSDADIIVAGPFPISGTAALVGVMKSYERMTGEKLNSSAVDAAMNELVVTGSIEADGDEESEKVEAMVAELKQLAADGAFDSEEKVREAVSRAAQEYGVGLNDEETQKLIDFLMKIKGLDLDWDHIRDQAKGLIDQVQDRLGDVDSEGFWDKVAGFFRKIIDAIRGLFA